MKGWGCVQRDRAVCGLGCFSLLVCSFSWEEAGLVVWVGGCLAGWLWLGGRVGAWLWVCGSLVVWVGGSLVVWVGWNLVVWVGV